MKVHGGSGNERMAASSFPVGVVDLRHRFLAVVSRSTFARDLYAGLSQLPVLGPIMRRTAAKVLAVGQRVWVRIPEGLGQGLWLRVETRFEPQFLDGQYELQVQKVLQKYLRPGGCFYDIGAHVGFFSLCASRIVGESGVVVAFEPDPENAEVLREAAQRNGMPQLKVVEAAVWSSSGPIEFQRASKTSSRVDGQVGPIANWEDENRIRVEGVFLDDFILRSKSRPPDLLKVDVEAAESEVLKGASWLFDSYAPLLLCEIHNATNEESVREWLAQRRYQFRWLAIPGSFPIHLIGFRNEQLGK
jgi:FkbM family methyltransferase